MAASSEVLVSTSMTGSSCVNLQWSVVVLVVLTF